ncbi:MAG: hypothetical protein NVSMB52_17610 [Chloroflexota bacterium]
MEAQSVNDAVCLESSSVRTHPMLGASYVLPLMRESSAPDNELTAYVLDLVQNLEVIVVDGSPHDIFAHHAATWGHAVKHVRPNTITPNGKVGGVMTGVRSATHERVIIADDDVRYTPENLRRTIELLKDADVVRPQNYFEPRPWHAQWDTARSLLNRLTGGDWPGTLAVRRSVVLQMGGYRGDVLFENLELVRTIKAAGGREVVPLDLFVCRRPPAFSHFRSQRVRQAYDELARPGRLLVFLSTLPIISALIYFRRWVWLASSIATPIALAELGRRRSGGNKIFTPAASLLAPAWLLERGLCSWLAIATRVFLGGVEYRDTRLQTAATPSRTLRKKAALLSQQPSEAFRPMPCSQVIAGNI